MSTKRPTAPFLAAILAVLAVALVPGAAAGKSKPGVRSFHGTVGAVAKDRSAVRLKRSGRSSVRFTLSRATVYERLAGASALRRGLRIEIKARKSGGRWIARKIETEGAGDDDAGDDHGGDRPKGVSDDPPGDDKGGDR